MADHDGGRVRMQILPEVNPTEFGRQIKDRLDSKVAEVGAQLGRKLGKAISQGAKAGFVVGDVVQAVRDSQQRVTDEAGKVGRAAGRELARNLKAELEARLQTLRIPEATVRVRLELDEASFEEVRARLASLGPVTVHVNVDLDTAAALARLAALRAEADRLFGRGIQINAGVNTGAASAAISGLGMQLAALAAIPVGTALAAGLGAVASAALAAGAGTAGFAAVAIPAVKRVGEALQAQKAAQDAVTTSTSTGLNTADQARLRALQMVGAEQQLTNAKAQAKQAEEALTEARMDARRAMEDLNNQVKDGALAERRAALSLQEARQNLSKTLADPKATELQREQARLAVDEALQQVDEQRLATKRLRQDKAAADRAGINGSQQVKTAQQQLTQALQQVAAAQRQITAQRIQDRMAQQQAAAATNATSAAQTKLAKVMGELSPAERTLMKDWEAFTKVYKDWVRELEPDVLPVLSRGIGLVSDNLDRAKPLVTGAAQGFTLLEKQAKQALDGPFYTEFFRSLGIEAPVAITRFGTIFGHTITGMAGVLMAFEPEIQAVLDHLDQGAQKFEDWGKSLTGSNGFTEFIAFAKTNAHIVEGDIEAIGKALLEVGKDVAPVTTLYLAGIKPLAEGVASIARDAPELFQLGAALLIAAKASRMLGITSLAAGLLRSGAAAGTAAGGMGRLGAALRILGGAMMGVRGEAVTTRIALLGLTRLGAIIGTVAAVGYGANALQNKLMGTTQSTDALVKSLTTLAQTGKYTGAWSQQFKGSMLTGRNSIEEFQRAAQEIADPSFKQKFLDHPFAQLTHSLSLGTYDTALSKYKDDFKQLDTALKTMAQGGQVDAAASAFAKMSAQLQQSGIGLDKIKELFPQYTALAGSAGFQTQSLTDKLRAQNQQLADNAHAFMSSEQEAIDYRNALNSGKEALDRNGRAFYGNSAAALDNRQQIINTAQVIQRFADDLVATNQVSAKNVAVLRKQRDGLVEMATHFGLSRKEAARYVDQLVSIPRTTGTDVTVNAKGKLSMKGLEGLVNDPVLGGILKGLVGNAGGGLITGSGDPRGDGLLTRISPGEMVINAAATARHLPTLAAWNDEGNKGTVYRGKGYAGGGIPKPTAWTLPAGRESWTPGSTAAGYAGGGIPLTASPYRRSYHYNDDADEALAKARKANQAMLAGAITYASGQTAIAATLIQQALLGGGSGVKAVQFAVAQLGEPYRWGATGPDTWDCSGLTQAAWRAAGVSIPRVTYDQIVSGTPTTKEAATAGDLYFPDRGHVMMVTGRGGSQALIHAPHTGDVVRFASWRSGGVYRHIGSGAPTGYGGGTPQAYARAQFGEFGWGGNQWSPLDRLWTRESGWRWNATNPSSGAYGIPQALPPSKMASAGRDWKTNWATQINWGLGYIAGRYGSPSGAWSHSQKTGWYAKGTTGAAPGLAWVGEEGPELVRFSGGETVYPHEESMRIGAQIANGYASGTTSSRLKPVRSDLKHITSDLAGSVSKIKSVLADLANDIKKAFKGIRSSVDDRLVSYLGKASKALQTYAKQRDKLASTIKTAKQFATDTGKNAAEFAGLTGLPTGLQADSTGLYATGDVFNTQGIISGLQTRVSQLNAYKSNLDKLAKLGVSKDLISQIIAAGPDRGAAYAQALASATPAQVKQLNSAQAAIGKASTAVGQSAADAMYDAGAQAGKGFLAGLTAQQKAIEKAMAALARSIQKKIKKELRIHSPSQVMADLGEQVGAGLAVGIDSSVVEVKTAAERMSALVVSTAVPSAPIPAAQTAGGGRGGIAIEQLHIHEVTDKATKQAVTDALHDVYVLHRSLL
ncbi:NlpC/P60 family protein [Actinomadura nitritigenes]|uniref:aggregation-promoting factor C-terminal-like domain-containing protein n=1 Tax=Actinomadura nitritigenes TaxID=134602 RepID=UPI003D8A82AF